MDKRAYYLELPDKDIAIMLMDDGEKQEILTTSPNYPDLWFDFMREKGFVVRGFSRVFPEAEDEDGEVRRSVAWYELTGNLVRVGTHSGLIGCREAAEEDDSKPLNEHTGFTDKLAEKL